MRFTGRRAAMRITTTTYVLVGALAMLLNVSARADERAILADIKAFFRTSDLERREQIVQRIQADQAYDRAKVGKWLHRAKLFDKRQPGRDDQKGQQHQPKPYTPEDGLLCGQADDEQHQPTDAGGPENQYDQDDNLLPSNRPGRHSCFPSRVDPCRRWAGRTPQW